MSKFTSKHGVPAGAAVAYEKGVDIARKAESKRREESEKQWRRSSLFFYYRLNLLRH
jgi:hypothetical protein